MTEPMSTTEPESGIGSFEVGDRVRCRRTEGRPLGSWPRYEGKTGVVTSINHEAGEVGVLGEWNAHAGNLAWFLPSELVAGPKWAG